jgi:peroxiredoxin
MALSIGDPAPNFSLISKTAEGIESVSLADQRGSNVVLLFVPLAFTGVCTDEFCSVSQGLEEYKALNAKVFGISVDSPFAQEAWAKQNDIKIPLLSDFNREVSSEYGASYQNFVPGTLDMQGVAKRSAFVIDAEGVVRYAEVNEDAGQLPDFSAVKDALKELS